MDQLAAFKALSNKSRLEILAWLKDPELHFPDQAHFGYANGVCVGQIQNKAGLSQSTVSEYLTVLQRAGLVTANRIGQWTYYQRNEEAISQLINIIQQSL